MTDERALYDLDREAWLQYVAQNMAAKFGDMPDAMLADTWDRMPRDYQMAVWEHLGETERARVRKVRGGK